MLQRLALQVRAKVGALRTRREGMKADFPSVFHKDEYLSTTKAISSNLGAETDPV